ncbi:hypothetical protein HMPREF1544_05771 [Mucor circinelloides 1006PhL]|uniref:Phosphatidate phosphatase APP1 catalytic domain-containing protein n=1 Tax=Mucor circinelloides f. circinelloides (strain 1006PhL) TaxID=1220926 RepID=S2JBA9_MUCC1|nr:hypothetical protein HMPREF1544_05771 [Mucor circinelloides 1006PhL]
MFENRFKYFMAKGKRNKKIEIEAIGAATNAEWIQLGNHHGLKSPLTPPSASIATPPDNLLDFQLQKKTPLQWQKIYDVTKKYMDQPSIVVHNNDDGANPLPIILNTSYAPTSMASNSNHHGANTSSDEDDEEGDSSCDEATLACPLNENGTTLKSEGTGVFEGEFCIADQQVKKWIRDNKNELPQEQDEERMIKIRSCSKRDHHTKKDFFFPPSYGIVQLIEPYGVSVISDIDDTIKDTRVLSGARTVLSNTFFNPTRAIPGMADAYLQWYNQGASYHYVSNSPFQLVHMLHQFINNHHFPPGSFHLRPSTGIISKLVQESGRSKRESICKILQDFPHRKFVLVGDSGEIDLEIYTRIAADFPGQIIKIFIRDITTDHHRRHHHHQSTQDKKHRRMKNKRSSTFPAFFSSNLSSSLRTESSPDLSSIMMRHDGRSVSVTDDEDENYEEEEGGYDDEDDDEEDEGLHDTATKLAELVLEPSLTGHQPLHIGTHSSTAAAEADDLPEDLQHHQHQHQHQQPASQSLIQLFSRLAIARRSVKGIDIVLFKESKELYQDEEVMHALARYRNSKQLQH